MTPAVGSPLFAALGLSFRLDSAGPGQSKPPTALSLVVDMRSGWAMQTVYRHSPRAVTGAQSEVLLVGGKALAIVYGPRICCRRGEIWE